MTLTHETLAELKRLHAAATQEPWMPRGTDALWLLVRQDLDLIAAMRNALPALIAAAEREARWREVSELAMTAWAAMKAGGHLAAHWMDNAEEHYHRARAALEAVEAPKGDA